MLGCFYIIPTIFSGKINFPDSSTYFTKDYHSAFKLDEYREAIILGNSKSLSAISPERIELETGLKTYHLGFNASSPANSYFTLSSYINHFQKAPKRVIFEVSWFSFNRTRLKTRDFMFFPTFESINRQDLIDFNIFRFGFYNDMAQAFWSDLFTPRKIKDYKKSFASKFRYDDSTVIFDEELFRKVFPDAIAGIDPEFKNYFERLI